MPRRFPEWICEDCAEIYGRGPRNPYIQFRSGACDLCGETAMLAEPRDFGHLKPNWREILMGKEAP